MHISAGGLHEESRHLVMVARIMTAAVYPVIVAPMWTPAIAASTSVRRWVGVVRRVVTTTIGKIDDRS